MRASGEAALKQACERIETYWANAELPVRLYNTPRDQFTVLGDLSNLQIHLEEHEVTVSTLLTNKYCDRTLQPQLRERIEVLEKKILNKSKFLNVKVRFIQEKEK